MQPLLALRHVEAENNLNTNRKYTLSDYLIPATERGMEQGIVTGNKIANYQETNGNLPLRIFVSPFKRTIQTCELVTSRLRGKFEVFEDLRLREIQKTYTSAPKNFQPDDHQARERHLVYMPRTNGQIFSESGSQVFDRVASFYTDLRITEQEEGHKTITVVITHGYPLRCLLTRITRGTVETHAKGFRNEGDKAFATPPNAQIYRLLPNDHRYEIL